LHKLISSGQYKNALQAALLLLGSTENKFNLYLLIAQAHTLLGDFHPALSYLYLANNLNPSNSVVLFNIGTTFLSLSEPRIAKNYFLRALSIDSSNVECLLNLAVSHQRLFQHLQARKVYLEALKIDPKNPVLLNNIGNCSKHLGFIEEAHDYLETAIRLNPLYFEAHRNLSLITKYTVDHPHILEMLSLYKDPSIPAFGKMHLAFALGRSHEMIREYDSAFSFYQTGNKIKRSTFHYDINLEQKRFQQLLRGDSIQPYTQQINVPMAQASAITPIFIVGMPRSGSTLLETILGLSSTVYPLDELSYLESNILRYAIRPDYSLDLSNDSLAAVAASYFSDMRNDFPFLPPSGEFFVIDKMPYNFRYVNFIVRAFPSARIIHTTRSAMDNTMSIYRELFTSSNLFSFTTAEISSYLVMERKLMNRWGERYPRRIHEVPYESLVSEPEVTVRSVCDYVGIQYTEELIHPERSSRSVTTASSVSARSPINTKSIGKWKCYEKDLLPLLEFFKANHVSP